MGDTPIVSGDTSEESTSLKPVSGPELGRQERLLVLILTIAGNLHTMDASTFREKADNGNYGR